MRFESQWPGDAVAAPLCGMYRFYLASVSTPTRTRAREKTKLPELEPAYDCQGAARNTLIRNPLELGQGSRARAQGGERWEPFWSAGTRHIERDAGVTSNSVAFPASSLSAVAIASLSPRLVASSQPRRTNLPVTSGATSTLTTTTPCCLFWRHRRVRSAPGDNSTGCIASPSVPAACSRAGFP